MNIRVFRPYCKTTRAADRASATNVVAFYNNYGACEQWIKEGKGAIKWTRLHVGRSPPTPSGSSFVARLRSRQFLAHAGDARADQRLISDSLKEKLIKISAKVVCRGRYITLQMAEVAIPGQSFQEIFG